MHPYRKCHTFVGVIADTTRFGDRLLDTWAMLTLMSYGNKSAVCHIFWQPNHNLISHESFSIGACDIKELSTTYIFDSTKKISFNYSRYHILNDTNTCLLDFYSILNNGAGNNDPITMFKLLSSQPYIPEYKSEFDVVNDYKQIASTTKPLKNSPTEKFLEQMHSILQGQPVIGIHIRTTDKIRAVKANELSAFDRRYFTLKAESESIQKRVKEFLSIELIKTHGYAYFYIATDDDNHFTPWATHIEASGGIVINSNRTEKTLLNDFFALSQCAMTLQVVRFSTFSIASAIINDSTLINFSKIYNNQLETWTSVLSLDIIEKDFGMQLITSSSSSSSSFSSSIHHSNSNTKHYNPHHHHSSRDISFVTPVTWCDSDNDSNTSSTHAYCDPHYNYLDINGAYKVKSDWSRHQYKHLSDMIARDPLLDRTDMKP